MDNTKYLCGLGMDIIIKKISSAFTENPPGEGLVIYKLDLTKSSFLNVYMMFQANPPNSI